MRKTEQSRIAFDQQADTYDSDFHGKHARELYPFMLELMILAMTTYPELIFYRRGEHINLLHVCAVSGAVLFLSLIHI